MQNRPERTPRRSPTGPRPTPALKQKSAFCFPPPPASVGSGAPGPAPVAGAAPGSPPPKQNKTFVYRPLFRSRRAGRGPPGCRSPPSPSSARWELGCAANGGPLLRRVPLRGRVCVGPLLPVLRALGRLRRPGYESVLYLQTWTRSGAGPGHRLPCRPSCNGWGGFAAVRMRPGLRPLAYPRRPWQGQKKESKTNCPTLCITQSIALYDSPGPYLSI